MKITLKIVEVTTSEYDSKKTGQKASSTEAICLDADTGREKYQGMIIVRLGDSDLETHKNVKVLEGKTAVYNPRYVAMRGNNLVLSGGSFVSVDGPMPTRPEPAKQAA